MENRNAAWSIMETAERALVLEGKVLQWMEEMKQDYAIGSQKPLYAAVLSFFDLNQYPLKLKRGYMPSSEGIGSRISEKGEMHARSRIYRNNTDSKFTVLLCSVPTPH